MRSCSLCLLLLCVGLCPARADEKKLADLAKKRYEAAEKAYKYAEKEMNVPLQYLLSVRLLNAQKDLKRDAEVEVYRGHYHRMSELNSKVKPLISTKNVSAEIGSASELFLVEAEFWLERAKLGSKKKD